MIEDKEPSLDGFRSCYLTFLFLLPPRCSLLLVRSCDSSVCFLELRFPLPGLSHISVVSPILCLRYLGILKRLSPFISILPTKPYSNQENFLISSLV
jgi:hypothetical protein